MLEHLISLEVKIGSMLVGQIAQTPERKIVFEYTPEFLSKGFSISPFYLPLKPGLITAPNEPFEGNFGVFNDSLENPETFGHRFRKVSDTFGV